MLQVLQKHIMLFSPADLFDIVGQTLSYAIIDILQEKNNEAIQNVANRQGK